MMGNMWKQLMQPYVKKSNITIFPFNNSEESGLFTFNQSKPRNTSSSWEKKKKEYNLSMTKFICRKVKWKNYLDISLSFYHYHDNNITPSIFQSF